MAGKIIADTIQAAGSYITLNVGNVTILTANSTGLTITPSSNLNFNVTNSIWTASPGSNSAPSLTFSGNTSTGIFFPSTNTVAISTAATEALRVDSSGNLGLGTTPATRFHVSASSSQNPGALISSALTGTAIRTNTVLRIQSEATGRDVNLQFSDNITNSAEVGMLSGSMYFTTVGLERMRIDSSGNVGINTTSPASYAKLAVIAAANGTSLCLTDNTQSTLYIRHEAGNLLTYEVGGTASHRWVGNSLERMRIDYNGNLLIGKTTASSSTLGTFFAAPNTTDGSPAYQYVTKTYSGTRNGILFYHGATYCGGLNFDNTTTSLATSSDVRMKKDIVDAPTAIDKVNNIRVVSYGWKHDEATVDYGFIAQELFSIAPEAVAKGDDGEEVEKSWAVDYARLVPMLVKSVQELKAIVDAQAVEIAALKAK